MADSLVDGLEKKAFARQQSPLAENIALFKSNAPLLEEVKQGNVLLLLLHYITGYINKTKIEQRPCAYDYLILKLMFSLFFYYHLSGFCKAMKIILAKAG
jgi:hypothetical protein